MPHAWLIIAHNEFGILQRLITALDAQECDFYVHVDKKVKQLPTLKVTKGRLFVLENRIDVRWGHVSQIETEFLLLRTAMRQGPYEHYHIISGTHLPLKPLAHVLDFYHQHPSEQIVRMWPLDKGDADFKIRRYHFPIRNFKNPNKLSRFICQFSWKCVLKVQKILGIRHNKQDNFYKTDNWLSLTEDAVRYLVSKEKTILNKYRWSLCGDEYFAATELIAAGKQFRLLDSPTLLYVDFKLDSPRSLALSDFPELSESDYLFARKFTEKDLS